MIRHVVLFSFVSDTASDTVREIIRDLNNLPHRINEILSWEITEDLGHREKSHRICLIATFADMESVERYLNHPAHVEVVKRALPHVLDLAEHDHEIRVKAGGLNESSLR